MNGSEMLKWLEGKFEVKDGMEYYIINMLIININESFKIDISTYL